MPAQRSVARTGLLLAGVLALCRFASLGKELLIAGRFGAGDQIDAYALALLVPALALAFYLGAVRRGYIVEAPRQELAGELATFTNRYLLQVLVFSTALAALAWWLLPAAWPLLLTTERHRELAEPLARLTTPAAWLILPTAAVSALTAVLNARHSFARPQWTHVLPTGAIVVAVLSRGTSDGAALLAWSLLAGTTIQAAALVLMAHRSGHNFLALGAHLFRGSRSFVAVVLPFLWMDAIGQLNVMIDRAMASWLPEGRLSVLYWSALGKDFLSGTLVASILWVLLPRFSEQAAAGDHDGLRHSCSRLLRFSAALLLPVSAVALVAGHSLIPAFSIGELDPAACDRLGRTLGGYAWGLFPELAGLALVQAMLVLGRWNHLAVIGLLGLFAPNLILNLLLITPLQEVGLAISTSATAWLLLGVAWWTVRRTIGIHDQAQVLASVARAMAFSLLAGCAGLGLAEVLGHGLVNGLAAITVSTSIYLGLSMGWPGHPDFKDAVRAWRQSGSDSNDQSLDHDSTRSVP